MFDSAATYRISYRTLLDGVTGVILTGFRNGRATTRMHLAAAAGHEALIQVIAEVSILMAVRGVEAEVA